jgi:hypothetical protein
MVDIDKIHAYGFESDQSLLFSEKGKRYFLNLQYFRAAVL